MSKNIKSSQPLNNTQSLVQQNGNGSQPDMYPADGLSQFNGSGIPAASSLNVRAQIRQNSGTSTHLTNGLFQSQVPVTPDLETQTDEQVQYAYYAAPAHPHSNGVARSQVTATPYPGVPVTPPASVPPTPFFGMPAAASIEAPVTPSINVPPTPYPGVQAPIADPQIREKVDQYTLWLSINNSLPVSAEKLQAYQEASLEIQKVGEREVRTFAPFQEHTSALKVITSDQFAIFAMLAVYWFVGLALLHLIMFTITISIVTVIYISGFIVSSILATRSFSSSSGEKIDEEVISLLDQRGVEWPTYTILCPLYKEVAVVPQFVDGIKALNYPTDKLQVLFLTEENDSETRAALYNMQLPPTFTVLTVPKGDPQTKPRACNFGLLQAKGQFVVIFDAEDKPEPYQLKKAVLTFANHGPEVACVQAKLNYYNSKQNILTHWFTAEYSTWFDIMLPGLQRSGFSLPLGGTSNHFRTEVLRALGGWDAFNVTEDCDLGLRISQYNLKTAVLDSTTYEEATSRFKVWLFQRSRWIKGYLQTYLVHMRHPVQMLQKKQYRKFVSLQIIVGAWTVVLLINPFMWALTLLYILFRPVQLYSMLFPGPVLYAGAFCLVFGNFFYIYIHLIGCLRRKEYSLIKWVVLIPLYWLMMSMSAYIAFYQLIVKPHYWEKTQHGNHLAPAAKAQVSSFSANLEPEGQAVVASMPTMRVFAVTVGKVFKQAASVDEIGTPTQRVTALRSTLSAKLGKHKVHQQVYRAHVRDLWLVATMITACIISIAACIYYYQQNQILLYGDSHSHLGIARRLYDSSNPYDITQLGAVWLPLPHILMWPFIWNDFLWHSGLAGSIVSMGCYLITCYYLYRTAFRLTRSGIACFLGTLAFMLNPDVLYIQVTPLSEMVCAATFVSACYYFLCWVQEERVKPLVFSAITMFLATLSRYDNWALFVIFLFIIVIISFQKHYSLSKAISIVIFYSTLASFGIVLWLIWGQVFFGNPLYFASGPYSSAAQQLAFLRMGRLYTYHNLFLSIKYYGADIIEVIGPLVVTLAGLGLFSLLIKRLLSPEGLVGLAFLTPIAFYVFSLYTGQAIIYVPGVVPSNAISQFFNVRYGIAMAAPCGIFIALLLGTKLFAGKYPSWSVSLGRFVVLFLIVVQVFLTMGGNIVLQDGQYGISCEVPLAVNKYLAQYYNGGKVLEDNFASRVDGGDAGFDFRNVIYEGSGDLWIRALHDPSKYATWIVADLSNPSDLVSQDIPLRSHSFLSEYTLVAFDKTNILLYHRNSDPLVKVHIIPSNFLSQYALCAPH